jgi:flagellar motor protein MotB
MDSSSACVRSDFSDSGSAKIRDTSVSAFGRIAWLLAERPYRLRIEGHTDNKPIHNAQFSDNWDLSAARATELVRLPIMKYGFAPQRLSAAGYAEYHPVNSNDTAEARAQNRWVDLVILGKLFANRTALPSAAGAGTQTRGNTGISDAPVGSPKGSPAIPISSPTPNH